MKLVRVGVLTVAAALVAAERLVLQANRRGQTPPPRATPGCLSVILLVALRALSRRRPRWSRLMVSGRAGTRSASRACGHLLWYESIRVTPPQKARGQVVTVIPCGASRAALSIVSSDWVRAAQ